MQLPDEIISYVFQSVLAPVQTDWTPIAEVRASHYLSAAKLKELIPRVDRKSVV